MLTVSVYAQAPLGQRVRTRAANCAASIIRMPCRCVSEGITKVFVFCVVGVQGHACEGRWGRGEEEEVIINGL